MHGKMLSMFNKKNEYHFRLSLMVIITYLLSSSTFLYGVTKFEKVGGNTNEIIENEKAREYGQSLLREFKKEYKNRDELILFQKRVIDLKGKAIPTLVEVVKSDQFSDQNRWLAIFLIGRIMGKKASPFLAKFLYHPSWVLRTAGLKTLLALKDDRYQKDFAILLKDSSLIVRTQALENIKHLNLKDQGPLVWEMMYRKHNYQIIDGKLKRAPIIKRVITTIGDIKYTAAKKDLLSMIQKESYKDIFEDIDYSLSKLTGKNSPQGDWKSKKNYWNKMALEEATF